MHAPRPADLVAVIALAVIAMATPATALECAEGQRSFAHAGGETCIPEHPERIITTRGDRIATPLIDIGAPLVGAAFRTDNGETYVRGAADIFGTDYVEQAGVASIGKLGEPDFETMAAFEPDLIIMPDWDASLADKASLIAPVVLIPNNIAFLDHLAMVADAAGMQDAYAERLAAYRGKIDKLKSVLNDPSAISISRFAMSQDGLGYYPNWGAMDQVIADIGFSRPAVQANATEDITISFERIEEFDADIILAGYAPRFGQTIATMEQSWDDFAPFWRELSGVKAGNLYWFERDVWVGYTFKSLETVADGLLLLSAGRFAQND